MQIQPVVLFVARFGARVGTFRDASAWATTTRSSSYAEARVRHNPQICLGQFPALNFGCWCDRQRCTVISTARVLQRAGAWCMVHLPHKELQACDDVEPNTCCHDSSFDELSTASTALNRLQLPSYGAISR